jgi:HSP20 family protein
MNALFLPRAETFREPMWRPAVDVYRCRHGWLIKFDLAGVQVADVSLEVQGRQLTVRGCRRDQFTEEGQSHYLMEIAYSKFERTVELPFDLEPSRMATDYRDGMLLVHIQTETKK